MSAELTATDLSFGYDTPIFKGVTVSVHAGEQLAILGKNGSGKTTLLRLFSGILRPTSGTLLMPSSIGWKGCDLPAYCPFSVLDILNLHPSHVRLNPANERDRIITQFNLESIISRPLETLSTGEQHRVLLARLFVAAYPMLVVDEPLTALDPYQQAILTQEFRRFTADGGIVMVASHDLEWVAETCHRTISLLDRILFEISPKTVTSAEFKKSYAR
ncbi:ATP-binding cassette domain-containing protein [bacterium]|nr:ATP-binding cassette domain-containing protein [bacterium]